MQKNVTYEIGRKFAQPQYTLCYIMPTKNETGENSSKTIILPPGIPTRDGVISAIITNEYPLDKMQAVQNNYFLDPLDDEAKSEMELMQETRKKAKQLADEFMQMIN